MITNRNAISKEFPLYSKFSHRIAINESKQESKLRQFSDIRYGKFNIN